jgi:hypothetical protein
MAGLFSKIKTWILNEEITHTDLNAEFDNIINNMEPATIEDASATVLDMQEIFDLGDIGTEIQPTSMEEELQGLRSMVKKITGEAEYYVPPSQSLASLVAAIPSAFPAARVNSGAVDGDNQPMFLKADGVTLDVIVEADPVGLEFTVDGQVYTKVLDDTITAIAGPTVDNTSTYIGAITGEETKYLGEEGSIILLHAAANTDFTAKVNRLSAFLTINGGTSEYFLGTYREVGGVNYIEKCLRGFLFDSAQANERVQLAGSQNITILTLNYIYVKRDLSLEVNSTNLEPVVSGKEPTSPAPINGDIWVDLNTRKIKKHNGSTFADAELSFLGFSAQDGVAGGNCVATRSVEFFRGQTDLCTVALKIEDDNTVKMTESGGEIDVYGKARNFRHFQMKWSTALDLDSDTTDAANTTLFFYITDEFKPFISKVRPHDRKQDLRGFYHPAKPWRCLGYVRNDGSSNFLNQVTNFGNESSNSDHSISTKKLARYKAADNYNQTYLNAIGRIAVVLNTTATFSSIIRVTTSGRPVMLIMDAPDGASNSVAMVDADLTVKIQRRQVDAVAYTDIKEFNYVTGALLGMVVPSNFFYLDNLPADTYEYRIGITFTGTSAVVDGSFMALEM